MPEKYKPLIIVWDNAAEQTAKKHGYSIEYFFDLDTLVEKRQELFVEKALEEIQKTA